MRLLPMAQEGLEEPSAGLGLAERLPAVAERLPSGQRLARGAAQEGAQAVAGGALQGGGSLGQAVPARPHQPLEQEQGRAARPAARAPGFERDRRRALRREELPVNEPAQAPQGRLEGGHLKGLHELLAASRIAKGKEVCHAAFSTRSHAAAML